jgi:hypothetical protein
MECISDIFPKVFNNFRNFVRYPIFNLYSYTFNMNYKNHFFYTTIYIVLFSHFMTAQVKYSNEFLSIGVGARAQGMSGTQVAHAADGTAAYWNPAGLAMIDAPMQVNAMHAEWFAGIAKYDFLNICKTVNIDRPAAFGVSVIRLGIDQIPYTLNLVSPDGSINYNNVTEFSAADYAALFSYGMALSQEKRWLVGGSAKVIRRSIGSFGSAWGFGLDAGIQYRKGDWRFGVMGRDISTTYNAWSFNLTDTEKRVFQATGNRIPQSSLEITRPTLITGGAYHHTFQENYHLLVSTDVALTTDGQRNVFISTKTLNLDPRFGVEMGYHDYIYIRGGVGNFQRVKDDLNPEKKILTLQPNFGIGIKLGRLHIDYALTNIGNVSEVLYSNILSARLDFKKN